MARGCYLLLMQRRWLVGALAVLWGCNGDTIPIDPKDESVLGDELPVDEQLQLAGLDGPVDAVRDKWGRMHIYATTVRDAMMVQGYVVARDRHAQLDLFRRFASGRLTEAYGVLDESLIEVDISFRSVGMHRVAQEIYDQSSDEVREVVDAYAAGVSQAYAQFQSGELELPKQVNVGLELDDLTEWTGVDCILMGRFFSHQLSYDVDTGNTALIEDLKATFAADATEPEVAARAGMELDYIRFAPPARAPVIDGLDEIGAPKQSLDDAPPRRRTPEPPVVHPHMRQLLAAAEGYERAMRRVRDVMAPEGDFGSNNWVIGGMRTATGRAMVASDPHLSLYSPSIWYPVSIHVEHRGLGPKPKDVNVGGVAFAGTPGVVLGHNEHIAWAATVAGYDVTDTYAETLNEDGTAVIFNGKEVEIETREEIIVDFEGKEHKVEIQVVPHHGPIIPTIVDGEVAAADPEVGAMSIRWTGHEPTFELEGIFGLNTAADVDEARTTLEKFAVGAQNWIVGDVHGDILWTTHAHVPYRADGALAWNADTYEGNLPCFVLPGDGTAEWTGMWADNAVPWAKNPNEGFLSTANADQVGGTFDNDPSDDLQPDGTSAFLACSFAFGFRQERVKENIVEHDGPITLEDMSRMQNDYRSPLGVRMVPALLLAIDSARNHVAGAISRPDLDVVTMDPAFDDAKMAAIQQMLQAWRDESDYFAEGGIDLDTNEPLPIEDPRARAAQATLLFNMWLLRFTARTFGDELARIGRPSGTGQYIPAILHLLDTEPQALATYDATMMDSVLWDDIDTPEVESRQDRILRALLDAITWLEDNQGPMDDWRWGDLHRLRFELPNSLPWDLAIPNGIDDTFPLGFPRHGDQYNVDACNFDSSKRVDDDPNFRYTSGPTQRFVAELDPNAVKARNALPGGVVWYRGHEHFADQAELWRRNQVHVVPFYVDEVIASAESRTLFAPAEE